MLRECYEMNKEIKSPWNFCGIYYIKTMETYCVVKNILQAKIQMLEKLNKID